MPIQEVVLSEQEKQIIKETQEMLGLSSIEDTIEYLAKLRIQKMLAKLAGQEVKKNIYIF